MTKDFARNASTVSWGGLFISCCLKSMSAWANFRWRKNLYVSMAKIFLSVIFLCAMNGAGFNTLFVFCMTRYTKLGIKGMLIGVQNSFRKVKGMEGYILGWTLTVNPTEWFIETQLVCTNEWEWAVSFVSKCCIGNYFWLVITHWS